MREISRKIEEIKKTFIDYEATIKKDFQGEETLALTFYFFRTPEMKKSKLGNFYKEDLIGEAIIRYYHLKQLGESNHKYQEFLKHPNKTIGLIIRMLNQDIIDHCRLQENKVQKFSLGKIQDKGIEYGKEDNNFSEKEENKEIIKEAISYYIKNKVSTGLFEITEQKEKQKLLDLVSNNELNENIIKQLKESTLMFDNNFKNLVNIAEKVEKEGIHQKNMLEEIALLLGFKNIGNKRKCIDKLIEGYNKSNNPIEKKMYSQALLEKEIKTLENRNVDINKNKNINHFKQPNLF